MNAPLHGFVDHAPAAFSDHASTPLAGDNQRHAATCGTRQRVLLEHKYTGESTAQRLARSRAGARVRQRTDCAANSA
jgi:hypothetical protein